MTVCMRALSPVSRILFNVRMMSDGSLLTGCSRLVGHSCLGRPSDVVVASMVKLSMIRRYVCCRSTLQVWCCKCHWRFSGDAPQCTPYSSYISFRPQPKSDELRRGVKSFNYYTLVTNLSPVQNQLIIYAASRWLVGLDDVIDSSGLWLLGRICRYWSISQCASRAYE